MSAKECRSIVERLADTRLGAGVLVLGTTPFVGEGFDAPTLDTLFLAAPISFDGLLVQCAGCVLRAAPGKTVAEVHDYHDLHVPLLAASLQRPTGPTMVSFWARLVITDRSRGTHDRVREDRVDKAGTVTLRHAGRLHHIGIGRTYAGTYAMILAENLNIQIIDAATGEILRDLVLDPTKDYQPTGRPTGPTRK